MPEKRFIADPNPWVPETDPIRLAHLAKFAEELNECGAATMRCIMQGIDEKEPSTGKPNREWLQDEMADVLANMTLAIDCFDLDRHAIEQRKRFKMAHLLAWHGKIK